MIPDLIQDLLRRHYVTSEVTSGEFIHSEVIPEDLGKGKATREEVIEGIQIFLDWDESDEIFDVIKFGNTWYTTEHFGSYEDFYNFDGVNYPTKILNVTIDEHDDDWVHSYLVAPESLYDAVEKYTGNTDDERFYDSIDSEVYHYIEDQYWDLPDEEIAKEHLDLPMTLIKED